MYKFYLISFDISDDKIRRKVVKILEANATRVQKSVFEAWLNEKEYVKVKSTIDSLIDPLCDSVRYYLFCKNCIDNIQVSGIGQYINYEDLIIV
ncbi:MAG: CRISPR-associated endonuclease Cas2 [Candidatus Cloacimonetes bacterium]|jgi:CRISPR-associated protein Cas2|nr:CRISPR-associated endonuclease Cas2 [Candidatus Cloacimonadota bacterium]